MSDLTFTSDAYGYMLQYKGQNIGGAGLMHRNPMHWKHAKANRAMFAADAERAIAAIEAGKGQARYMRVIDQINFPNGTRHAQT